MYFDFREWHLLGRSRTEAETEGSRLGEVADRITTITLDRVRVIDALADDARPR